MIDLEHVFSFRCTYGTHDRASLELFLRNLEAKTIAVTVVTLPRHGEACTSVSTSAFRPCRCTEACTLPHPLGFSGRSMAHMFLCSRAAAWLSSVGRTWSAAPNLCSYAGGAADVAETGGEIFVECGFTNVRKALDGLAAKQQVVVAPYADDEVGYWFRPLRDLLCDPVTDGLNRQLRDAVNKMPIALRYEDVK